MIVRLAARRIASKPRWTAAQQRALATDAPPAPEPLSGSVGEHARHLVLFTGRSFDTIPSHIDTVSPLYRRIVARMKDPESPLSRYALAVTDSSALKTEKSALAWQQEANRFDLPDQSERGDEAYGGVIYPDGVEIPFALTEDAVATKQLDNFCGTLSSPAGLHNPGLGAPRFAANGEIDVFVCTHGARDCRCGDVGSAFYDSLLQEARRRKLGHAAKVFKEGSGPVRIHRVTHVGGHRFAATCFTSTGDWYGLLSPSDASNFLQYLDKQRTATRDDLGAIWWSKWRGRAGLSQDAQLALAEQGASYMQEQGGNTSASATDLAKSLKKQRKDRRKPLGDAVDVPYLTYEGEELKIRAFRGETLMDAAKRRDLVEATCGGACECATCHVHLRPADHGKPAPVPEVTDEEDDQLEYAMFADDDSRLACQIEITEDLVSWLEKQGGRVQLPRY